MILTIFSDSIGRGHCRSCGAAITWAELASHKKMPFDGELVSLRSQGNLLAGDRATETVDTAVTKPHFATCPDAHQWSRKQTARRTREGVDE
jgi:hypothetical protein